MFIKPYVTKTYVEHWSRAGAWKTKRRRTYTFIDNTQKNPEVDEQRDDEKRRLEDQRAVRLVEQGRTHMFVDETQGNDEAHCSSVYTETTGNNGTSRVNFSSPIGEGRANMFIVESRVHPE